MACERRRISGCRLSQASFIAQLVYITAMIICIFASLPTVEMYGLSYIHMHRVKSSSQDEPALALTSESATPTLFG